MRSRNRSTSLAELQRHSVQNRVDFLRLEVASSFTFVRFAETEYRAGNMPAAKRSHAAAEKGHSVLSRFLNDPKHLKRLTDELREELTAGMERLRDALTNLNAMKRRVPR